MKDNGGPAFPCGHTQECGLPPQRYAGMSLRDYFAAAIMQGYSACVGAVLAGSSAANFARYAYEAADAMLAERAKDTK